MKKKREEQKQARLDEVEEIKLGECITAYEVPSRTFDAIAVLLESGVSRKPLNRLVHGKVRWTPWEMLQCANLLGMRLEEIFEL